MMDGNKILNQQKSAGMKVGSSERECVIPLTESQRGYWVDCAMGSDAARAYNDSRTISLRGPYDHIAMHHALQKLIDRHEALRTRIGADGETQIIAPRVAMNVPLINVSHLPRNEREAEARRALAESAAQLFYASDGSLFRALVVKIEEELHLLTLTFHHIIGNGPSYRILLEELCALYEGRADLEPAMQLSEFVCLQPALTTPEDTAFWLTQFTELPPPLELPLDHPRPRIRSFRGSSAIITLDAGMCLALREMGNTCGCSLFMTLFAAFTSLIHRLSGQDDIVVGSTFEGGIRNHKGGARLVANTTNVLPLRSRLQSDCSFADHLETIKKLVLSASQHKEYFFGRLFHALNLPHDPARSSLFSVLFNFYGGEFRKNAGGLDVEIVREGFPYSAPRGTAMFDLSLDVMKKNGALEFRCDYCVDLFDGETVQRWLGYLRRLLTVIVENLEVRVLELPLLDDAERDQILIEWNDTRRGYQADVCLHELIEAQVERTPDAVAIVFEDESITYRQLNGRANRLAHRLRDIGVAPEVLVGILAERSIEMVVGLLAALKAGGAYLPLDPNYPVERLMFMLGDAKPPVVLAQASHVAKLLAYTGRIVFLDEHSGDVSDISPRSGVQADDLAYVLYTSGSTGQPKGVMITHRGICNRLLWIQESIHLALDDCMMVKAPLTFDVSVSELFWPLIAGASVVLAQPGLEGDSRYLIENICENGVTTLELPPALISALLEEKEFRLCLSLRRVISGAEQLPYDAAERFLAVLPHAELYNSYGPTETAIDVTFWQCKRGDHGRTVPIGRPHANTQMYILDRAMQPVPIGVAGELHLGGVQLARGYLNRPELTAEKFVTSPFGEGRLYKTGDLGRYRADGAIEFLGRIDHQVKLRGFRIELGEIEAVLKKHSAVRDCVVLVQENGTESNRRLVAYVVASGVDVDQLRRHAQKSLPDYMVPSAFVFLDQLPLTANGKLDRRALPAPEHQSKRFIEPQTPLQRELAVIWQDVLGLERVGLEDNFFELGGHSLLAVRIFSKIETMFGKRLPLATLFQAPTIEALATALQEQGWKPPWSPLVAIQARGSGLPFFGVHGGYGAVLFYSELARCLGEDQPFYGLQFEGLDGGPVRHTSIETIASYYIEEIRRVQAHGPYFLGGYCVGGIIAFEMARQLRVAGEPVGCLALFDVNNPVRAPRHFTITKRIRMALDEASDLSLSEKLRYFGRRVADKMGYERAQLQKVGYDLIELLCKTLKRAAEKNNSGLLPLKLPVWIMLQRAASAYKPSSYPGRIIFFRPTVAGTYEYAEDRGWAKLAEGGLEIHDIPGKHGAIFERQYAPVLAEKLDTYIRAALGTQVTSLRSTPGDGALMGKT
jgi:amino acid adenylation domain-containing protein